MANRITNYKQLMAEKERLEALAKVQQQQIKDDLSGLKDNFMSTVGIFITRKAGHVLANLGASLVIDKLLKRKLLRKANWFIKYGVPFFMKNVVSHLVDKPEKVFRDFASVFGKNGKKHQEGMDAV